MWNFIWREKNVCTLRLLFNYVCLLYASTRRRTRLAFHQRSRKGWPPRRNDCSARRDDANGIERIAANAPDSGRRDWRHWRGDIVLLRPYKFNIDVCVCGCVCVCGDGDWWLAAWRKSRMNKSLHYYDSLMFKFKSFYFFLLAFWILLLHNFALPLFNIHSFKQKRANREYIRRL